MQNGYRFRWVYLQVMSLKRCITDKAIHNWTCNLPVDLMAAYDQLWETIKEHDESDIALAERAIMWVLCSFKPLETEFLLQAIRYVIEGSVLVRNEEQTQQQILLLCQDLLTIDEERGVWMLPHASVAEYFEKRGRMKIWECDVFASKLCLNFLDDSLPNDDYHFASYVGKYWHKHVGRYDKWLGSKEQEVEQEVDPDLAAALKRFLGSPGKSSANFQSWNQNVNLSANSHIYIDTALAAMCKYGFYYTLRDWWTQPGKITVEVALKGDVSNALLLSAQGHCMPICRHLAKLIEAVYPKGDIYYIRALLGSLQYNNPDMAKFLVIEAGADVNIVRGRFIGHGEYTAAQIAASRNPKMLQWLMDQGVVDLERENDNGCVNGNVLITAVSRRKIESVRILLKAGANADAVVHNGSYGSALIAAARCTYTGGEGAEIVQLLLDHGADPNRPMRGGQWGSVLEASVDRDWDSEFGEDRRKLQFLLLEAAADPAAVFDHGSFGSALAAAAFWAHKESLKTMVDRVGTERAIEAFRQSRHPGARTFRDQQDIMRWHETATYLAEEVGVSQEILHAIGFWDVKPEPHDSWEHGRRYKYILRYNSYS